MPDTFHAAFREWLRLRDAKDTSPEAEDAFDNAESILLNHPIQSMMAAVVVLEVLSYSFEGEVRSDQADIRALRRVQDWLGSGVRREFAEVGEAQDRMVQWLMAA